MMHRCWMLSVGPWAALSCAVVLLGATACTDSAAVATVDAAAVDAAVDGDATVADSPVDTGLSLDVPSADLGADLGADDVTAAVDAAPATCSAAQLAACDDGLDCTEDSCTQPYAVCAWKLKANTCLIGGVCVAAGAAKAGNGCSVCQPEKATQAWSLASETTPCTAATACTFNNHCAADGSCVGDAVVCDDGNPCTSDACDPQKGCTYPPLSVGTSCNDDNACTTADACQLPVGVAPFCQGLAIGSCSDSNPCTDDACDPAQGCTHTDNSAPCSDGDACTAGDLCTAGVCVAGAAANCDDGNNCTLEVCDKSAGCYHLPTKSPCCIGATSICDDNQPCTTDDCDPQTGGCSHVNNIAPCADGNACTGSDVCSSGACKGTVISCDDKNPCTTDACAPATGCVHTPADGAACDDGNACTSGDVCKSAVCAGSGACACVPSFAKQASKLTSLQIGNGGKPGEGLDVDGSAATCAPAGCSAGIDNELGSLAGLVNPQLLTAVDKGSVVLVLEYKDFKQGPISLALYQGALDPSNPACAMQTETCSYLVSKSMVNSQTCQPMVALNGTLTGNALSAGGKGTSFPFSLPLQGGVSLNITIFNAKIVGTVALAGGVPTTLDAILGGAVPKDSLMAAIDALPDQGLPLPKDSLKALLDNLVSNDIDTNGDGQLDAASIGFKIKGIAAVIVGEQ